MEAQLRVELLFLNKYMSIKYSFLINKVNNYEAMKILVMAWAYASSNE